MDISWLIKNSHAKFQKFTFYKQMVGDVVQQ
jgi:hypothetical protein